ncbi:hypothetical protein MCOR32_002061 [Pyricularia oryzae]|uniref:Uncharacterized protein n=1 Tax=Pyricularia grisea TaxID=148305 RepID=A0ABQ8NL22_PYRGI|nr:hypothetical protein MCOR33_005153 [Pyricularia grisea]KAI6384564.1 hypothetical protein MCOR32_002061 [Pyricularia oryzae]KAI6442169.1 hypothetical protein MCOR22_006077 [Pyricularia oryzae]
MVVDCWYVVGYAQYHGNHDPLVTDQRGNAIFKRYYGNHFHLDYFDPRGM